MKKILSLAFAALLLFAACDGLELTPVDALDQRAFFQSDEDAVLAVNGVYAALVESQSVVIAYLVDLASDATRSGETMLGGSGGSLSTIQYDATNSYPYYAWGDNYYGIANANVLIDQLADPDTKVSDRIRKRVTGEAKFLRAYYYFSIVQLFGEIPLVIESGWDAGANARREDVHAVYKQITDDLKSAAENLSEYPTPADYSTSDKGRVSQSAAYGLLAKVYLVWAQTDGAEDVNGKLDASISYAEKVTGVSLEEHFHANWDKGNRYGKESLFAANYIISQESFGDGGNHLTHCAFFTTYEDDLTPHVIVSDRTFYDRFDDRDQRKEASFLAEATNPDNGVTTYYKLPRYQKYIDPDNRVASAYNRELNATILRYADVLLVKAEAINERFGSPNGQAYEAINQVRRRAYNVGEFADGTGTAPLDEVNLKNLDYAGFTKALRRERFYEFVYEQQRWYDLVRWKVLLKTIRRVSAANKNEHIQTKHYRFPVPQSQRDLNGELWQNWGYDGSVAPAPPYADSNYEGGDDNNDGWTDAEARYLYGHVSVPPSNPQH
ncbi:SusD family protein [Bacteroidales bacterium Barb6XT]|nr:SusD family protein [Bacteroidales bacterium Barb6XT]